MVTKYITKASGEREAFDIKKFKRSLQKSGASAQIIEEITNEVLQAPDLTSTRDIYVYALNQLKKARPAYAARYNLKYALSELGPSGFPFEHFVAEIFKQQGYEALVDQEVPGFCITHEVDVILKKDNQHILIECKYHQPHLKANVKTPLYIKARFDDLEKKFKTEPAHNREFHQAWIVTNTKFTSDATAYAECVGLQLISWSYPEKGNLASLVEGLKFHPITVLTSLTRKQKQELIKEGLVLCKDVIAKKNILKRLGLSESKIKYIIDEAEQVCELSLPFNH